MKAALSILFLASLVGCATGQPSAFERTIYDVRTQVVATVTLQTNYISLPGGTNVIPSVQPVTNYAEAYQYHPKESVITGIQTGGQIATTFGFGLGGVIASLVLGGYGAWATWRSNRKGKLVTVMAQGTELAREVIKATAGAPVESRFMDAIKSAQVIAGVKPAAAVVAENQVDTVGARNDAQAVLSPARVAIP